MSDCCCNMAGHEHDEECECQERIRHLEVQLQFARAEKAEARVAELHAAEAELAMEKAQSEQFMHDALDQKSRAETAEADVLARDKALANAVRLHSDLKAEVERLSELIRTKHRCCVNDGTWLPNHGGGGRESGTPERAVSRESRTDGEGSHSAANPRAAERPTNPATHDADEHLRGSDDWWQNIRLAQKIAARKERE